MQSVFISKRLSFPNCVAGLHFPTFFLIFTELHQEVGAENYWCLSKPWTKQPFVTKTLLLGFMDPKPILEVSISPGTLDAKLVKVQACPTGRQSI